MRRESEGGEGWRGREGNVGSSIVRELVKG